MSFPPFNLMDTPRSCHDDMGRRKQQPPAPHQISPRTLTWRGRPLPVNAKIAEHISDASSRQRSLTAMLSFSSPDVRRDPYPMYEQARIHSPAVADPQTGLWMVFDYDGVKQVLTD